MLKIQNWLKMEIAELIKQFEDKKYLFYGKKIIWK